MKLEKKTTPSKSTSHGTTEVIHITMLKDGGSRPISGYNSDLVSDDGTNMNNDNSYVMSSSSGRSHRWVTGRVSDLCGLEAAHGHPADAGQAGGSEGLLVPRPAEVGCSGHGMRRSLFIVVIAVWCHMQVGCTTKKKLSSIVDAYAGMVYCRGSYLYN